jgi:hypothetical protein
LSEPKVVATLRGLRLVQAWREQERWPGTFDLVLEHVEVDAMGAERWRRVDSWVLSDTTSDASCVALYMLLKGTV